jgi:hypothetical protein
VVSDSRKLARLGDGWCGDGWRRDEERAGHVEMLDGTFWNCMSDGRQKWTETRIGNYSVEIDYLRKHLCMSIVGRLND